ncbi:MAG: universal stress protein [Balneolaceae bacterium]
MKPIQRILLATDFSDGASAAIPAARQLAENHQGRVDIIHVIPMLRYLNESLKKLSAPVDLSRDVFPEILKQSEVACQTILNDSFPKELRGEVIVKIDRKPSEVISEIASDEGYDLIVMGTRGEHTNRAIRGTITEKVIRHSRVPVLSVDEPWQQETIGSILLPTDTSELSFTALPMAANLAFQYGAKITIYHVLELYGRFPDLSADPGTGEKTALYELIIERLTEWLETEGLDHLHVERSGVIFEDELRWIQEDGSISIPLSCVIEKGISAHQEIERYARNHADLVVLATHGRSGLAHIFLGSTAEKVAQYVGKPVLTVRPALE